MEMLTFPILIVTFLITLWLTSHIAKQLYARQPGMPWVFTSWLVGIIFGVASLILLDVLALEPMLTVILQIAMPVFFSTLAFVLFTQVSWGGALTTNIAGVFIGLILSVVAMVVLGLPLEKTFSAARVVLHNGKAEITSMVTGKPADLIVTEAPVVEDEIELEPVYTSRDFLPEEAQKALAKQDEVVLKTAKYRDINVFNARRAVGKLVRASWKDGRVSSGKLEAVQGGDLIVTLRRKEGLAQVPIAMSKLKKLEVYR